jgi:hypothetical protein
MKRHRQIRRMGSARNILPAAAAAAAAYKFPVSNPTPYSDQGDEEDEREYWEMDDYDVEIAEIWANAPAITAPAFITTQVYQFGLGQEDDTQEAA